MSQRGDIALQLRWNDTMVSVHVENVAYYPDVLHDMGKQANGMFKQLLEDTADFFIPPVDEVELVGEVEETETETSE